MNKQHTVLCVQKIILSHRKIKQKKSLNEHKDSLESTFSSSQ